MQGVLRAHRLDRATLRKGWGCSASGDGGCPGGSAKMRRQDQQDARQRRTVASALALATSAPRSSADVAGCSCARRMLHT